MKWLEWLRRPSKSKREITLVVKADTSQALVALAELEESLSRVQRETQRVAAATESLKAREPAESEDHGVRAAG